LGVSFKADLECEVDSLRAKYGVDSNTDSTQSQSALSRPKNTLSLLERFYSGSTASNDVFSVKEVDQYFAEPTITSAYDKAYDILLSYW